MYDIYYLEIILEIHFEQHLISNNIHRHFFHHFIYCYNVIEKVDLTYVKIYWDCGSLLYIMVYICAKS